MSHSNVLFRMPAFSRGFARTVDIGAGMAHVSYRISRTPAEADAKAVAADWSAVGDDLRAALAEEKKQAPRGGE